MAQPFPLKLPPVDIIRRLHDALQPNVPRRILDAGSGTGRNARFLTELGHWVVSLDGSFGELRSSSVHPAVLGDVRQLPFGAVFDIAIMNEVTHMLPSKDAEWGARRIATGDSSRRTEHSERLLGACWACKQPQHCAHVLAK